SQYERQKGRKTTVRLGCLLVMGLLMLTAPGCKILCLFARTMIIEPLQFCNEKDTCRSHASHYALARNYWRRIECEQPDMFSADYERGYKDGFTDYLDFGGCGAPPPVPPRRYWKNAYQTPQRHQAIQDWFAGFRHGASDA